jgi:hypothetical protein
MLALILMVCFASIGNVGATVNTLFQSANITGS